MQGAASCLNELPEFLSPGLLYIWSGKCTEQIRYFEKVSSAARSGLPITVAHCMALQVQYYF